MPHRVDIVVVAGYPRLFAGALCILLSFPAVGSGRVTLCYLFMAGFANFPLMNIGYGILENRPVQFPEESSGFPAISDKSLSPPIFHSAAAPTPIRSQHLSPPLNPEQHE
jgi:hypothetical protein